MNTGQSVSSVNISTDEKPNSQMSNATTMKRTNLSDSTDSLEIKRSRLESESEPFNNVISPTSTGMSDRNNSDLGTTDKLKFSQFVTKNLKTEYYIAEDVTSFPTANKVPQSTNDIPEDIDFLVPKSVDGQVNSQQIQLCDNTTTEKGDVASGGNIVRQGNINRLTVPSKVVSRLNIDSNIKNASVMVATKKVSPDVPQTTAKVSIGNTTISVPLLKPINSSQIVQSQNQNRENQKQIYPTVPVSKILNVKQKPHPTIVSLSIKPVQSKIVNAKLVSKKITPPTPALNVNFPQQNEILHSKTTMQSKIINQNAQKKKTNLKNDIEIGDDSIVTNIGKVTKKIEKSVNPKITEGRPKKEDPTEVLGTMDVLITKKNPSLNLNPNMSNSAIVLKKDVQPSENADNLNGSKDTTSLQSTVDATLKDSSILNIENKVSYLEGAYAEPSNMHKPNAILNITNVDQSSKNVKDTKICMENTKEELANNYCKMGEIESPNLKNMQQMETINADDMLTSINVMVGKRADNIHELQSNFDGTVKHSDFCFDSDSGMEKVASLDKLKNYSNPQIINNFSSCQVSNNILSTKSDDNQNALLKQLLQNSSNSQSNKLLKTPMKTNSPPVTSATMCSQLISTRKVINVRAPSLGLVSSLEAQLARPVIPPVTTNLISAQIQHKVGVKLQTHLMPENQIINKNGPTEDHTTKQCHPKQIVSKETSFISNPHLNPCLSNSNMCSNESEQCKLPRPDEIQAFENTELKSNNYKELHDNFTQKLNPSISTSKNTKCNGNQKDRYQNIGTYDKSTSTIENTFGISDKVTKFNIYEKNDGEKNNVNISNMKNISDETYCLSSTKGIISSSQIKNFVDISKTCTTSEPVSDLVHNDNKQNLINTIKNESIRKKRKRDNQKLRRPILKNNKESVLSNVTKSIPYANQKKKVKKIVKMDEDYDHYIDKVMVHMRNMESIEIIEPLLDCNFAIGRFYERSNKLNNSILIDFDGREDIPINNHFGTTKFPMMKDYYDTDSIKKTGWENNRTTIMHNEFYDQEFCSFITKNDYNKLVKFIRQISGQQRNGAVSIKTNENLSKVHLGHNTSSMKMFTFPGMFFKNYNRRDSIDRMSPIIPYVNYDNNNATNANAAMKENLHFYQETISNSKQRSETNETVILTLPLKAESKIVAVLKDLANILNIIPPHKYKVLKSGYHKSLRQNELKKNINDNKKGKQITSISLQKIFNGNNKICRNCGNTVNELGIRLFQSIPKSMLGKRNIYLCNKLCLSNYKEQHNDSSNLDRTNVALGKTSEKIKDNFNNIDVKKVNHSQHTTDEFMNTDIHETDDISNAAIYENFNVDIITPKNYIENIKSEENLWETYADKRQCSFCNKIGDGASNGPSRLLNYDNDKWVHLNCALWSNCVYETVSGSLMNFQNALDMSLKQHCSVCQDLGATVKCCKSRCSSVFHLPCAIEAQCVFLKNKSIVCQHHSTKLEKENELSTLNVERRVYIERDEVNQINSLINTPDHVLRIGTLTFLNIGHLFPNQVEHFHSASHVYPVGYKSIRFYWSMKRPNKRCRYICSISEVDGRPEFSIKVQEPMESELEIREESADAAWNKILKQICELRKKYKMIELYPQFLTGDDLFGLTEPNVVRMIENLPGIETLSNYRLKYGRLNFQDSPLPINSTGAARTEPKHHQLINCRKPHTQRTCSVFQRDIHSASSVIAGEVACPYSKQFVHSKSSQYKKMKQEWRNNVFLARSKIQGLGLYAARDIEKHTMIIEYIGEIIRTEVSEIREKQYEAKNRGIYMFRLDEDRVVDATLCGGLARYINHSCNPNCVTETVDVDREHRIIIFAKRKISRGEELCYDYKFDIEDDANKLACMCTASNCRKWMN